MDHRSLIASLSPEERLRLTAKADGPGLRHLAGHWGAIFGLGAAILAGVPGWPLLLPVQGVLVAFLFTLHHEAIHRTAFATGWLNDWVARVCGVLLLLPTDWFRYFHLAHHRHTQDPERDPELAVPKPETLRAYLAHVSGLPVWWGQISTLIRNARGRCADAFVPAAGLGRVRREARAMLAGYAVLAGGSVALASPALIWVWLLPAMLGQPVLRLYLLAEHGRCAFVADMLANSRTTFTTRAVRWLAWNMPYHAEHHAYPAVPFHRLPAFHAIARAHLSETEQGYTRFHARYLGALGARERRPSA